MRDRSLRGFTLIELLIAMAIVAILATIAYPSYQSSVIKSRRADGKSLLLDAAAREERFFAQYNQYTGTVVSANGCAGTACGLGYTSNSSPDGYYTLSVTVPAPPAAASTYTLTATPAGVQAAQDHDCTTFTLTSVGAKSATGNNPGSCW